MSKIIVSGEKPEIINNLISEGFEVLLTESICMLPEFEKNHADMQYLRINDTLFILNGAYRKEFEGYKTIITKNTIGQKYPDNVLLNAVYYNKRLYGKLSSVDSTVLEYCHKNDIETINVNQGYTKCSTAIFSDGFITADKGIFLAMTERGERGLLISPGNIELDGVDYGFIGGCCFEYDNTIYFSGDISKHPDYKRIKDFFKDKKIKYLSDKKLYDIGGFVVI